MYEYAPPPHPLKLKTLLRSCAQKTGIPQHLDLKLRDELEFFLHHLLDSKPLEQKFSIRKLKKRLKVSFKTL